MPRTAKEVETGEAAGLERVWWIAVMVGIFERILITMLVAYDVSGSKARQNILALRRFW